MRQPTKTLAGVLAVATLVACGGGGGAVPPLQQQGTPITKTAPTTPLGTVQPSGVVADGTKYSATFEGRAMHVTITSPDGTQTIHATVVQNIDGSGTYSDDLGRTANIEARAVPQMVLACAPDGTCAPSAPFSVNDMLGWYGSALATAAAILGRAGVVGWGVSALGAIGTGIATWGAVFGPKHA